MNAKKYSLCLSPTGEAEVIIDQLITKLGKQYKTPIFKPHLTLAGHISVTDSDLPALKTKINQLAKKIKPFYISLDAYGYLNEIHRCLYLEANSRELKQAYITAASFFPQVQEEHFQSLPHVSVMYGQVEENIKRDIIKENKLLPLQFQVQSLDLYVTNGNEESWQIVYRTEFLE